VKARSGDYGLGFGCGSDPGDSPDGGDGTTPDGPGSGGGARFGMGAGGLLVLGALLRRRRRR
jgi:hypothetical protein